MQRPSAIIYPVVMAQCRDGIFDIYSMRYYIYILDVYIYTYIQNLSKPVRPFRTKIFNYHLNCKTAPGCLVTPMKVFFLTHIRINMFLLKKLLDHSYSNSRGTYISSPTLQYCHATYLRSRQLRARKSPPKLEIHCFS